MIVAQSSTKLTLIRAHNSLRVNNYYQLLQLSYTILSQSFTSMVYLNVITMFYLNGYLNDSTW